MGRPTPADKAALIDKGETAAGEVHSEREVIEMLRDDPVPMITMLRRNLQEGRDYDTRTGSKPFLTKAGAERVCAMMNWRVTLKPDLDLFQMLGGVPGMVAIKAAVYCTPPATEEEGSHTPHSYYTEEVSEGFGAASLLENPAWSVNNVVKMAGKRAYVDVILRAACLSGEFTQDREDLPSERTSIPQPDPEPQNQKNAAIREIVRLQGVLSWGNDWLVQKIAETFPAYTDWIGHDSATTVLNAMTTEELTRVMQGMQKIEARKRGG